MPTRLVERPITRGGYGNDRVESNVLGPGNVPEDENKSFVSVRVFLFASIGIDVVLFQKLPLVPVPSRSPAHAYVTRGCARNVTSVIHNLLLFFLLVGVWTGPLSKDVS